MAFFVVATVGFGPLQLDHLNGKFAISVIGESHGVLMVAWLLTFIAQAALSHIDGSISAAGSAHLGSGSAPQCGCRSRD